MNASLALLLLALPLAAQSAPPPAPQAQAVDPARVEILPGGRVDLGNTGPRERRVQQYQFKNISTAPIQFRLLEQSNRTGADGPLLKQPIPPGESLPLTVWVDPDEVPGFQPRVVKLATDDPRQGHYQLPLAITVRPDLTVDVEKASFKDVAPHESPERVFHFKRETGEPTQIRVTSKVPPYLTVETEGRASAPELRVVLNPAKVPDGMRLGLESLVVETNAPQQPKITLYLDWNLSYPIEAKPTRLVFLDSAVTRQTLQVASVKGKPFRIATAVVEGEGFSVEPPPNRGQASVDVIVHRQASRSHRAVLVLRFEGEDLPLRVPLAYFPPES